MVVTILAILWTIAFISLQWYSKDARDSARLNDIKIIEKWFSLHKVKDSVLPSPDFPILVTASWVSLWQQGSVSTGVLVWIWQAWKIIDPLDGSHYSYFRGAGGKSFQLLGFMENDISLVWNGGSSEERFPKVQGDRLWILKDDISKKPLEGAYSGATFDIFQNTQPHKSYLEDNSSFLSTDSSLWSFMILSTKIQELYEQDPNLIWLLDYNIVEEFISPLDLQTDFFWSPKLNNWTLDCNGSSRLVYGSGSDILWGSDEFTIFVSYTIEEWENISTYPLVISSWGVTSGYNVACQHNLANVAEPSLICYVDINDGVGNMTPLLWWQDIEYWVKQQILLTWKNGMWRVYFNGVKVTEEPYIWTINVSRWEGLWVCARSTWGYHLNWIVDKVYISSMWMEIESNIEAFFEQISQ